MKRYAISACLMGENCKYNGGNNMDTNLVAYMRDKAYITICPEILGGLTIPRTCCEIRAGRVVDKNGSDVTEAFIKGAQLAIKQIKAYEVDIVIVQPRSPSCGKGKIYDGNFENQLIDGNGIFVDMLIKEGLQVMNLEEFHNLTKM